MSDIINAGLWWVAEIECDECSEEDFNLIKNKLSPDELLEDCLDENYIPIEDDYYYEEYEEYSVYEYEEMKQELYDIIRQ